MIEYAVITPRCGAALALAPNLLLRCCARTFKRESELRCFGIKSNKIEELTSHVTRPTGSASRGSQSVVCLSLHRLQAPGLTLCVPCANLCVCVCPGSPQPPGRVFLQY
jgi:hypothetical protein